MLIARRTGRRNGIALLDRLIVLSLAVVRRRLKGHFEDVALWLQQTFHRPVVPHEHVIHVAQVVSVQGDGADSVETVGGQADRLFEHYFLISW